MQKKLKTLSAGEPKVLKRVRGNDPKRKRRDNYCDTEVGLNCATRKREPYGGKCGCRNGGRNGTIQGLEELVEDRRKSRSLGVQDTTGTLK